MDAAERDAWRVKNFASAYQAWLMEEMDAEDYSILFDVLYGIEFVWPSDIPRDEDRAAAGQDLRLEFEYESGMHCDDEWLEWPCSFLEMLVGLAWSIEDHILYDWDKGDRSAKWFWMMMTNLGLDICTDEYMTKTGMSGSRYVERVVETVITRSYDDHGNGGLFPLWEPETDQRKVEIWYQANAFILENNIS